MYRNSDGTLLSSLRLCVPTYLCISAIEFRFGSYIELFESKFLKKTPFHFLTLWGVEMNPKDIKHIMYSLYTTFSIHVYFNVRKPVIFTIPVIEQITKTTFKIFSSYLDSFNHVGQLINTLTWDRKNRQLKFWYSFALTTISYFGIHF